MLTAPIEARLTIESLEIPKVWNIGAGGKTILGRANATKVIRALLEAGFEIVRKLPDKD